MDCLISKYAPMFSDNLIAIIEMQLDKQRSENQYVAYEYNVSSVS